MIDQLCRFSIEIECRNSDNTKRCNSCGWNPRVIPSRKEKARKRYYDSLEKTEYFVYQSFGGKENA